MFQIPKTRAPTLACEKCFIKLNLIKYRLYYISKHRVLDAFSNTMYQSTTPNPNEEPQEPMPVETSEERPKKPVESVIPQSADEGASYYLEGPLDLTEKKHLETEEIINVEEVCINDYNCTCESCQNKYGSLPLLLQGIEQKCRNEMEKSASTSPSSPTTSSTSKKALICQYCNKTFFHKGDYNKHLRTHTREQPFLCSICDRKFAHTSNLQRHLRLHSGQKPFACQVCHKSFSRKDKLESHKKSRLCHPSSSSSLG